MTFLQYDSKQQRCNTAIVKSCSARSDSIEVGGMAPRELSNSLIFFYLSFCRLKYFQPFWMTFSIPSPYHLHIFIFDVGYCSFMFLRTCQIYPPHCHQIPVSFEATREIVLVHVSTSINRIADTVTQFYMLSISAALPTD